MIPSVLTALVLFVALPLNWYVSFLLVRLAQRSPDVRSLRVVAVMSLSIALIVTVFALVFVNNGMDHPPLDAPATQILTRGALLVLSVVPTIYWLRWYRRSA